MSRPSSRTPLPRVRPEAEPGEDQADGSLADMVGSFLGAEMPETLALRLAESESPRQGEHFELRLRTLASPTGKAVARAAVRVELISPMREPDLLAEARTDGEGWLTIAFLIPQVDDAMAVLVVTAAAETGEAEETILL